MLKYSESNVGRQRFSLSGLPGGPGWAVQAKASLAVRGQVIGTRMLTRGYAFFGNAVVGPVGQ